MSYYSDQDNPQQRPGMPPQGMPPQGMPPRDIGDDPAMRLILPVGTSIWAIAAGYFGLFSVLCLPAPLAVLFGVIAILDIRRNPRRHGLGRAIFGIVMGTVCSIFLLVWLVALLANGIK